MRKSVRKLVNENLSIVRARTWERECPGEGEFDMLDFYTTALNMGLSEEVADEIDTILTSQVMRAKGAI